MGTNYYAYRNTCPHCGRSDAPMHLGKSSAGWPFLFQGDRDEDLKDWPTWKAWLMASGAEIRTEYGDVVSVDDLEAKIIAKRRHASEPHVARAYRGEERTADGDCVSWRDFT